MDPSIDVSVITVSYNTRVLTIECLRSLYAQTRDLSFEVLVVDNASADGSAAAIAAEFPQVRLFALYENVGFAAANNFAAPHARGDFLLLLNPDTVVLDHAVDRLVTFARAHPEAGILGGCTLSPDGRLNSSSCWARPSLWSVLCQTVGLATALPHSRWFNPEAMPDWHRDTVRVVDIVTGCFLLLRCTLWAELGGFDPSFFMYGEDVDLCLRAAERGIHCMHCPDARIVHIINGSGTPRAEKMVRLFRARAQLYQRHWPPLAARLGIGLLKLHALLRLAWFGLAAGGPRRDLACKTDLWRTVWNHRATWIQA